MAIDGSIERWRERAIAVARRFIATRLSRERAMADFVRRPPAPFQAGLFDRRAEKMLLAAEASASARAADISARLARLERDARLDIQPVEILLVLAP